MRDHVRGCHKHSWCPPNQHCTYMFCIISHWAFCVSSASYCMRSAVFRVFGCACAYVFAAFYILLPPLLHFPAALFPLPSLTSLSTSHDLQSLGHQQHLCLWSYQEETSGSWLGTLQWWTETFSWGKGSLVWTYRFQGQNSSNFAWFHR